MCDSRKKLGHKFELTQTNQILVSLLHKLKFY